jgi:CO/xanthine dehydrogenase Mo-binding subunit
MNDLPLTPFLIEPERYELLTDEYLALGTNRREFLRLVGGGIVVALLLGDAEAKPPRGRSAAPAAPGEIGAWLHIGADSTVTVYTGKVEIGQNIRTSLTQVVAEELCTPPGRIRLVMADTALTPYDFGTAGSRTTPAMGPQLRRVAAAARELLLDLAAERAKVERPTLTAADGRIVGPQSTPSFTFGELTEGKKLLKVVGDAVPTTPVDRWKVAGTSAAKVDGRSFVTGAHAYASDVKRPGMLHGKVLRPPAFKAKLVSVRTEAAKAIPGVTVVHEGEFVAVAAATEFDAARAVALIQTEWKTEPQPSGDELFAYLKSHKTAGRAGGGRGRDSHGSVEEGLKAADRSLEATYTVAYIAHCPLEPRAATAEWTSDGLTVWTGTQMPFGVRRELAAVFDLPPERVRVIVPDMGSGYGGKHTGEAAVEAARLAKAAGKPVKLVWTREEEFSRAYFRPAGVIELKAGVRKDGLLTAWECHNWNSGASALETPYEVPNRNAEFHGADSPLRQGSYRGLAATANHFARESHMDDLAREIGIDPLAFRLRNLKNERLRAVLEAAAARLGWGKARAPAGHGFGIAGGTEKGSYVASCAEVSVDEKTRTVKVLRVATAFECGAIVNPDNLKNQIEGGVIMALGGALFEEIKFADGKILNPRFSAYRVPRFGDIPVQEVVLLNRKDLPSAGAGETPLVALAPAVGNAIVQATGIRIRSLPMVPGGLPLH